MVPYILLAEKYNVRLEVMETTLNLNSIHDVPEDVMKKNEKSMGKIFGNK